MRKMVDFANRAGGIMIVAVKVKELGDWRVIPLSTTSNITSNIYSSIEKLAITVDMIRNAKRLDDWLRESRLLY
jgi:Holliday junction resolvase